MSSHYIKLDSNNLIIGVMCLSGDVEDDSYIKVDNLDYDLIRRIYDNGKISESKYTYDQDMNLIIFDENITKEDENKVLQLEQLVADLTEIVLIGGGA